MGFTTFFNGKGKTQIPGHGALPTPEPGSHLASGSPACEFVSSITTGTQTEETQMKWKEAVGGGGVEIRTAQPGKDTPTNRQKIRKEKVEAGE